MDRTILLYQCYTKPDTHRLYNSHGRYLQPDRDRRRLYIRGRHSYRSGEPDPRYTNGNGNFTGLYRSNAEPEHAIRNGCNVCMDRPIVLHEHNTKPDTYRCYNRDGRYLQPDSDRSRLYICGRHSHCYREHNAVHTNRYQQFAGMLRHIDHVIDPGCNRRNLCMDRP